ncbi:Cna B-type domain-containing protein [Candidatus Saccharibacteria bacterium]|nr:Cna B-type domain-containing protein [Candidatus Saccharibacteria bacterium]
MVRFMRKRALVCGAAAFVTAAVVFAVTLVINNFSAFAATINVQYSGTSGNFYSNYFTVDGKPAYCSWHAKAVPTGNASQIKNVDVNTSNATPLDKLVYKVIYYGQINGYTHQQIAIAINNANSKAGAGPNWNNPGWYGYNNGYVITDGQVNGATRDAGGVSKSDLLTLAENNNLPVGKNMHLIIWSNGNNNTQNLSQITYETAVEEKFNVSVVKHWNDTDENSDLYMVFNNNSVSADIVPHSANISIAATVNVSYNGTTKVLRNFPLNQGNSYTNGENNISCHKVKSDLFGVTNDYSCSGLSVSTEETVVPAMYESTFSSTVDHQSVDVSNGETAAFIINNQFYTTHVNATKTWNDKGGERPSYITFDVRYRLANSTSDTWATFKRYEKLQISGNSPEHFTFMNLPAFLKINGKFELVEYKAFEVALYDANQNDVTSAYEMTEGAVTIADLTSGGKVIGRITSQALINDDLISLPVEKIWVGDENYLEDRPEYIVVNLMCGDNVVLDDQGNSVELTLNEGNGWKGEFTGIIRGGCDDPAGYYATEVSVPEGYTAIEVEEDGTWKLYNYHGIDVKVRKEWIGDNPDVQSLSVDLVCDDDRNKVVANATLNPGNNWEYSWSNRNYNECSNHKYYVYERGYNGSFSPAGTKTSWDSENKVWNLELDNIKTIDIPVEKAWAGRSSDVDAMKFEVKVVLLCEDNNGDTNPYMYDASTRAELTLNAANDWNGTFTNILGGNCRSFGIAEESTDGTTLYQDGDMFTNSTAAGDFKLKVHYTGDAANGFTVTNEEIIDIPVWKSWDDEGDNIDTDRPESIEAILYCVNEGKSKVVEGTKTLTADNEYSERWTNLSTSKCASYEVEEVMPSSHGYDSSYYYESAITGNEKDGFQITNTKYVNIPVAKVWNYRNPSNIPDSVDIVLVCNDRDVPNTQVTLTKTANQRPDGAWFYDGYKGLKASDCPASEHAAYTHHGYTVREIIPQGASYNATVTSVRDGTVIIKNNEEFTIPVEKVWDSNRSDDDLPDEVEVSLFCGPYSVETITLKKSEDWRGEFGPLTTESCVEPERYEFFVVENTEIPGFIATIDGNADDGFTITNTEYTHLEVHKTWDKRDTTQTPASLQLQLVCKDGGDTTTIGNPVNITESDGWSYDFTNLKTSACSNYDVEEYLRYAYNFEETNHSLVDSTVDLTNKEIIYIPVEKAWTISEGTNTPDEIEVSLYCGATDDANNFRQTITLEKRFDYYGLFGPFMYDECTAGYNVTEDTELDGFESVVVANDDGSFTITNTEHTDLSVRKNWVVTSGKQVELPRSVTVALWCETTDSEVADKRIRLNRPNYQGGWSNLNVDDCENYGVREVAADGSTILSTVGDRYNNYFFFGGVSGSAAEGFTITNSYDGVDIDGEKTWIYTDNYGNTQTVSKRPTQVTVNLLQNNVVIDTQVVTADASGKWNYNFDGYPRYDANGNAYSYAVDEVEFAYYEKTIDGYNITNQYAPEYTSVTAAKDWATLKDTQLPEQVEVRLYCGETDLERPQYITKASNWAAVSWNNLDASACEAGYSVKEVLPEDSEFASSVRVGSNNEYTFTNAETVDVPVKKEWVKKQSTALPESVTVGLFCELNNNKTKLDEQLLSEANNWSYTWAGRNVKNDNCVGGAYIVDEISTVENFKKTSVDYTASTGYTIVNTELTSQKVIKVWEGDTAQDRPGSITADLMCGNTIIDTVELSEANNADGDNTWEYNWDNLLVSDCAQGYSVRESVNVPNYKTSTETLEDGTVVITNRHTTDVKVIKVWKNDSKEDRPGYIEASLLCGDKTIDTVKLSEENNLDGDDTWEYTWKDLYVSDCKQGYSVTESIDIPNYHKTIKKLEDGTFEITNELDNPETSDNKILGIGSIAGLSVAVLGAGVFVSKRFFGRR